MGRFVFVLAALVVACGGSGSDQERVETTDVDVAERAPTIAVDVAWDTPASIYDVLARDESAIALVQVRRRTLPSDETAIRPSGFDHLRIATTCEPRACVDGLVAVDQLQPPDFDRLVPCGVRVGRLPEERDDLTARLGGTYGLGTHPDGVCRFLELPSLTPDDRETLGEGAQSWLERGIRVTHAEGPWISFYRARASFSEGAAHSNAEIACRTLHDRDLATFSDVFGEHSDAVLRAVTEHLIDALVEHEERAASVAERCDVEARTCAIEPGGFASVLRESETSAVLCFPSPDPRTAQRVRVRIPG